MQEYDLFSKLRAQTGITADDVTDSDLSLIVKGAVDEYNYYRPALQLTAAADAIETVAEQPDYALPSDALWIIEVCWNPGDLGVEDYGESLDALFVPLAEGTFDPLHPSELTVIYQRVAEFRRYFQGKWKVINGKIWLIPPPSTSGDFVAVYYAKSKVLADLNAITDQPFVWLCQGLLMERQAQEKLGNADWRAGTLAVGSGAAVAAAKSAEQKLERARSIVANPYYAERTGPGFSVKSE